MAGEPVILRLLAYKEGQERPVSILELHVASLDPTQNKEEAKRTLDAVRRNGIIETMTLTNRPSSDRADHSAGRETPEG